VSFRREDLYNVWVRELLLKYGSLCASLKVDRARARMIPEHDIDVRFISASRARGDRITSGVRKRRNNIMHAQDDADGSLARDRLERRKFWGRKKIDE
jgi:hypothetical protein